MILTKHNKVKLIYVLFAIICFMVYRFPPAGYLWLKDIALGAVIAGFVLAWIYIIIYRKEIKDSKYSIITMIIFIGIFIWSTLRQVKLEKELQKQYPLLYNQVSPE